MPKKRTAKTEAPKPLEEIAEQVIRDALHASKPLSECGEEAYCTAVIEALHQIGFGLEIRLGEIADGNEEEPEE